MESGFLSLDEFRECVERFVETSCRLGDGWHKVPTSDTFYMRKTCTLFKLTPSRSEQEEHMSVTTRYVDSSPGDGSAFEHDKSIGGFARLKEDELVKDEDDNCVTMATASSQVPLGFDFHVVYSDSYAVPVLYFNVSTSNGQRLSLDEVWAHCSDSFQPYLNDNKWTILTQQEHPLLGRPFLMLHPCHTADFMSQVLKGVETKGKINYLTTWLSTVGPLIGLDVSSEYAVTPD